MKEFNNYIAPILGIIGSVLISIPYVLFGIGGTLDDVFRFPTNIPKSDALFYYMVWIMIIVFIVLVYSTVKSFSSKEEVTYRRYNKRIYFIFFLIVVPVALYFIYALGLFRKIFKYTERQECTLSDEKIYVAIYHPKGRFSAAYYEKNANAILVARKYGDGVIRATNEGDTRDFYNLKDCVKVKEFDWE